MVLISYLTPVNPGMAMPNTFPSLSANGFNPYALHLQQHPFVYEPTSFDIQLGKEKAIFNHSGNRRFRNIINSNLDKYIAAPTKSSKSKLIRQVHADMQKSGYRFLRKNSTTGIWYEIEKHNAREKVSHALRDRVREQQKPTKRRRKNSVSDTPPSPTSVVSIKEISPDPPLNIPTLCNDDLILNQSFSRDFFEVATFSSDDNDIPSKPQRRHSLLSNNDDYHVPVKTKRRLSLFSMNDSPSKPQRHLSSLSLDDATCCNASRRLSMLSTDSATPSKALRGNSLIGMFDGFARQTNSGDHCACTHLEPYSLDDEFELLEMEHDFSTHLDRDQDEFDAFHNMPIRDVAEFTAAHLAEIACAL